MMETDFFSLSRFGHMSASKSKKRKIIATTMIISRSLPIYRQMENFHKFSIRNAEKSNAEEIAF